MLIRELEDILPNGAVTDVQKRFKKWFDISKAEGLQYVSITLSSDLDAFLNDPLNPTPSNFNLDEVLEGVLEANRAYDKDECHEYVDDVERQDMSEAMKQLMKEVF